jgi:magnesium chelatase subunit I
MKTRNKRIAGIAAVGLLVGGGIGGAFAATSGQGDPAGDLASALSERTGEQVSAKNVLAALPDLPVIDTIADRLGARTEGQRAAGLELALEALYLAKKIDKTTGDGETVYG